MSDITSQHYTFTLLYNISSQIMSPDNHNLSSSADVVCISVCVSCSELITVHILLPLHYLLSGVTQMA